MGKPAARIGDMHTCPMVTPGTPPIPHVGGPVNGPGCPTVLIGGQPAALMGDMCTCVGPPDTIVLGSSGVLIGGKPAARMGDSTAHGGVIVVGCPTVLIGETAAGGGGGLSAMPVNVMMEVMQHMPPEIQKTMEQVATMKQAAEKGAVAVKSLMGDAVKAVKGFSPKEFLNSLSKDDIILGLDVVGASEIPIVSQAADLTNAGISIKEGNLGKAGVNALAAIPGAGKVGDILKLKKYGNNFTKAILPSLDSTGKVHGILPKVKDLSKFSKEELEILRDQLKQSVQQRIKVTSKLGRDKGHGQRQAAEQQLIKSIEKHLQDKK